jgi:hypothetical protein
MNEDMKRAAGSGASAKTLHEQTDPAARLSTSSNNEANKLSDISGRFLQMAHPGLYKMLASLKFRATHRSL